MTFATTRWSVVRAAAGSSADARAALETLCAGYWYPLYAFARRTGRDAHAAEDAVQGFFAKLLRKHALAVADPARGRFRDFLLAAFRNHLRNEFEHATALKRGGRRPLATLDVHAAESRLASTRTATAPPDRLYERDWALALLERVLRGLRERYAAAGQERLFDQLKETLAGDERTHASRAAELGMTAGAFKVAAHRLRGRYREALRAEILATLPDGGSIEEEIRALFAALATV